MKAYRIDLKQFTRSGLINYREAIDVSARSATEAIRKAVTIGKRESSSKSRAFEIESVVVLSDDLR